MKRLNTLGIAFTLVTLILTVHSAATKTLPDPSGPNLIELSKGLSDPEFLQLFVSTREMVGQRWPDTWPDHFPYGTDHLEVVIVSTAPLRYGTSLITRLESESGAIELQEQTAPGRFELSGKHFMMQDIDHASGPFPSGSYTCTVNLNGRDIAQLSWTIDKQNLEALPETEDTPRIDQTAESLTPEPGTAPPSPLTERQPQNKKELQEMYLSYLAEEGYKAEIDADGDIRIEHDNYSDYIFIDENDLEFFRLVRPNIWNIESEEERFKVLKSADAATSKSKVAKVYTIENKVHTGIEIFVARPKDFEGVFKRALRALGNGHNNFRENMKE
jgi:hypothetical protein